MTEIVMWWDGGVRFVHTDCVNVHFLGEVRRN